MSGTNRLINSIAAKEKGSKSTLTSMLMDANNVAKKDDRKGEKKENKKK